MKKTLSDTIFQVMEHFIRDAIKRYFFTKIYVTDKGKLDVVSDLDLTYEWRNWKWSLEIAL